MWVTDRSKKEKRVEQEDVSLTSYIHAKRVEIADGEAPHS